MGCGEKEKGAQEKWGCRDESEWGYAYGKSSNESDPFLFFALSSTKKSFQVPYFGTVCSMDVRMYT